jgi:hypothetical protein
MKIIFLRFLSCRLITYNTLFLVAVAVTTAIVGSLHVRCRGRYRR